MSIMSTKFTPGPWVYNPDDRQDLQIKNSKGWLIAEAADNRQMPLTECQQNAHLIAAAPELLDALTELLECDYTSGTHLYCAQIKAKAAIAKATGQPII